jgi:hypothetical protein
MGNQRNKRICMALTCSCCYVVVLTLSFTASTSNKKRRGTFIKRTAPDKPNADGRHDISYIQKRFSVLDTKNIQSD